MCAKLFVRTHINAIDYILTTSGNTKLDLAKVKVSIYSIARRYTNCMHAVVCVCVCASRQKLLPVRIIILRMVALFSKCDTLCDVCFM